MKYLTRRNEEIEPMVLPEWNFSHRGNFMNACETDQAGVGDINEIILP
jgi:hypothetical protein